MKKIIFASFFLLSFIPSVVFASINVQEVTTEQGVKVWVVEDKTVPVVAMNFAFRGGIALDPKGKEGLSNLLSEMLTQGAGTYDGTAFQKKLDDLSIGMSFSASRDSFFGSLKTLSKNEQEAFNLLRLVLAEPRFDQENVDKVKTQIIAGIEQNQKDPGWLVWRNFNATYYKDHPYSNPGNGFLETVPTITVDDMRAFMKDNFTADRLDVVFVGDITLDRAKTRTEEIFGHIPAKPAVKSSTVLREHETGEIDQTLFVDFDVPQTSIVMAKPGLDVHDPDWHAALVANYLIGGGSFSSKLMEDIRVQKGLTYGISSSFTTQDLSDLFVIQTSTKSESANQMLSEIKTSLSAIKQDGFSATAIDEAKTYLMGSLMLGLTSTDAISSALLSTKLDKLPKDYLNKRNDMIKSVTPDDVKRVIARLFSTLDFTTVLVGQKIEEQ